MDKGVHIYFGDSGAVVAAKYIKKSLILFCRINTIPQKSSQMSGKETIVAARQMILQSEDGESEFTHPLCLYCDAINALTSEGVFAGSGEGKFNPSSPLSWAQMVTVFTRFTEATDTDVFQMNIAGHWAEAAIKTAVARKWTDDTARDLQTPVSFYDLVSFVSAILEAEQ